MDKTMEPIEELSKLDTKDIAIRCYQMLRELKEERGKEAKRQRSFIKAVWEALKKLVGDIETHVLKD